MVIVSLVIIACTHARPLAENSKLLFTSPLPKHGTYGVFECTIGNKIGVLKSGDKQFHVCIEPIPNDILIHSLPKYLVYLSVFANGTVRLCDRLVPYQVELSIGILSHHLVAEECHSQD